MENSIDQSDLNKAILREHYNLPTVEEIFTKMKNIFPYSMHQMGISKSQSTKQALAWIAGAVEYTDCILWRGKASPTSILDMSLNNLMVRCR